MKKFLALTLLLGLVQLIISAAIMVGVFRQVDLRFNVLLRLMLLPPFQAAFLLWATRDPAAGAALSARHVFRHRLATVLCCADMAILALVLMRIPGAVPVVFGAHALTAAALFLSAVKSVEPGDRWVILLTATGLALFGLSGFWNWLALLPSLVGDSARVLRWAMIYGPLFGAAVAVLLRATSALRSKSVIAAGWIEISIALLLFAALIIVSNVFFHPYLAEPWKTLEHILAYSSITAMMLAVVALTSIGRDPDAP